MSARKIATIAVAGTFALGLAVAPATANPSQGHGNGKANGKGKTGALTTVQFTKSVKQKLKKDGIGVTAYSPAKRLNSVTFTLPASQAAGSSLIQHTGALAFVRADRGVLMKDIVVDMANGTVNYTAEDGTEVKDIFDLAKVKTTKKTVKANWVVAAGQAAVLNSALSTTVFTDGMFVAKADTKFKKVPGSNS